MATLLWTSSPTMLGVPSSPLNPNAMPSSSSPVTSPTPNHSARLAQRLPLGTPTFRHRHSHDTTPLRYARPMNRRSSTASPSAHPVSPSDFFSEATNPVESAMWKERFARRVRDRERRKQAREDAVNRRRSHTRSDDDLMEEEEADRKAQEDDEEIFRRLMVLQRRKMEHAQQVSYETETGGSDPMLPDFWEEELEQLAREERAISTQIRDPQGDDSMDSSPTVIFRDAQQSTLRDVEEEEWARLAAEEEQAEKDMEEMEIARRVEEAYGLSMPNPPHQGDDMDWEDFGAMDIDKR